eukprot:COSAG05_NODE_231_length_13343_cov_199.670417_6_plen_118_part_00
MAGRRTRCYNILVISHAYNRGYGTGYAIPHHGVYIIRYHLMTYVSHLKPEGLTSSPLRGLTHDSTWLANHEPSSGLTFMVYAVWACGVILLWSGVVSCEPSRMAILNVGYHSGVPVI